MQDALARHRHLWPRAALPLSGVVDGIDRCWAGAILFMNGWIYTLPVTGPIPIWFTPIQVARGIFVHEILLIGYFGFVLLTREGSIRSPRGRAAVVGALIGAIGLLAMISAIWNVRSVKEVFSAGRYFLLAAYFFAAIRWAKRYGFTFVLRTFLLGELAAACVNLYYTYFYSGVALGGLPMLLGQNGPGGYLGISVVLSAWLMLERTGAWDMIIAIVTAIVALAAVSISFSKLSMSMAALGIVAWLFVLWQDFNTGRARRWYAAMAAGMIALIGFNSAVTLRYLEGVLTYAEYKFRYMDRRSIITRTQYFLITGEILATHPLFGAGLGGFYDAEITTDAYKSDRAAKDDPVLGSMGQSHPESSFLYYAAGTGFIGLCVVTLIFAEGVMLLKRALWPRKMSGRITWLMLLSAYLVFGLTLPTLFNGSILYLPAAIATCMRRRREPRTQ